MIVERDVPCAMSDGCVLRANVFRPDDRGRHPVLVLRTPYDKNYAQIAFMTLDPFRAVEAGYVVVHQDCRARFASEGRTHAPFVSEFADGRDTVRWAGEQPWSSGAVGVYGTSYQGFTAWAAAVDSPPALRAVAPSQAPGDTHRVFWRGGAFQLGMHLFWTLKVVGPMHFCGRTRIPRQATGWLRSSNSLPTPTISRRLRGLCPSRPSRLTHSCRTSQTCSLTGPRSIHSTETGLSPDAIPG